MDRRRVTRWVVPAVVATMSAFGMSMLVSGASAGAAPAAQLYAWGDNVSGELGGGLTGGVSPTPVAVALPAGVTPTAIAGGGGTGDPALPQRAAYAIGSDGNLYAWGDNSNGALGDGVTGGSSATPAKVDLPTGVSADAITAAQGGAFALGSDHKLYAWGDNTYDLLGNGTSGGADGTPQALTFPTGVTAKAIAAGFESAYAIGSDGNLYAWGDNVYGELGDGDNTDSDVPVLVSLPTGVHAKTIAAGGGYALALGSDNKVYAWGYGPLGELGDGATTNSNTPVVVSLPGDVTPTAIAAGGGFGFALASTGTLYAWGADGSGQLGDGTTTTDSSTPVVVSMPMGVTPTALTGGVGFAAAIGSDGKLYVWGDNTYGELGNGATGAAQSTPAVAPLPPGAAPESLGPEPGAESLFTLIAPGTTLDPTAQPANDSVFAGTPASFTASATGTPTPTVQWQVSTNDGASFSTVPDATSDTLTIASTTDAENGNEYKAAFTNAAGVLYSNPADLTVQPTSAPSVATQPTDQAVPPGATAKFTAAAIGAPTPTVQWLVSTDGGISFTDVSGAMSDTLTIADTTLAENGNEYEATFTNIVGSATAGPATLTVTVGVAPSITTDPLSQSVFPGQPVTFTAAASGDPTPTVQWQFSTDGVHWQDISPSTCGGCTGATSTTYQSAPLSLYENGWQARAVFTNFAGSATSNPATVTVSTAGATAPAVTVEPTADSVASGQPATFTAAASGNPTPTVQWQFSTDGVTWQDISPSTCGGCTGATSTTYQSAPLSAFENGWQIHAVFTNLAGSAMTDPATVTVTVT